MSSIELGLLNDQSHHHHHQQQQQLNRKSNQFDLFTSNPATSTATQSGAGAHRKKSSIHHKLSFTNISRLNLNYSPELKNKKNHHQHPTIKKSSTYQANSDDILLSDRSLDTTDHSKSMANEIAGLGETSRHKDTSRSILSLFFIKNKLNERNWSRRHASPSGTLTNMTNENQTQKSQISLKSLLRNFLNNIGLFFMGLSVSILTCSFLILSTFLLRKSFNIIDHDIVQTDNFTYNIEPVNVTMIYMNCNFCYFAVWTTTSCFSLVYPVYFIYKLFSTNCFRKKSSHTEQFTLSTSVSSNSDTQQQQQQQQSQQEQQLKLNANSSVSQFIVTSLHFFNQNSNRKIEKIEPIKIKLFCFKIVLTTLLWILTGYTFLRALDLIHFSDFIILFSVNISFTYMATWIILQRQFLPLRLVGFILAIAAIIFIYYSEGFAFNLKFLGNLLITSAAAGSAILHIVWHDVTDKKENGQRTMFLTLIGVCNLLLGWPMIFILDITGVETLSLTLNKGAIDLEQKIHLVSYIVMASVFAVCYVLLLQFGHLITNQIFLQFGNFLAIPISLMIDIKVNDLVPNDLKIGAFLSITVSYLLLIIPENFYTFLKNTFWPDQPEPETNSLTRRYKQATTTNSPSPILNH